MAQNAIFGPFFIMILLTLVVWVYMYAKRIPFIRSRKWERGELTPSEFSRLSPPHVSNPSDNLRNLFEVPTIFYAFTIYLYVTSQVDVIYLVLAWIFVLLRVAHSVVHCTVNIVHLRFGLHVLSTLALILIILRAARDFYFP
jgi:hypothetical protein